ncbi:MAG: hypothetical protein JWL83_803 [Actinomycetia bacterium]|nr:hypothetical protein [Actinomycetes bacterium]
MCRRRLALELDNQRGNPPGNARFEVSNRISADARLAHTELAPPEARAFVLPTELLAEQQRVYAAAVAGYLTLFGSTSARAVDTSFETPLPELEVRLVGDIGVALETDDGVEVRVLRVGDRGHARSLLDDIDLRFITLRAAPWSHGRPLRLVVAELLNLDHATFDIDVDERAPAAYEWVAERVAFIRSIADSDAPRAGHDCLGCRFVNGCRAHG